MSIMFDIVDALVDSPSRPPHDMLVSLKLRLTAEQFERATEWLWLDYIEHYRADA